jgi:SOS regulatory protein LexA
MYQDYKNKIVRFYERERRMPSYQEIMSLVGFKSKNAVFKLVEKLCEEGVVTKDGQGRLIPAQSFGDIPLLGLVQAGNPTQVDPDTLDTMSLDGYLISDREKTFLLEVKGDSMIEAHIEEGDLVVAVRTSSARDGDIVVAEVDGEWTLKYYKESKGKRWLLPANKNYAPIYPKESLRIAAVVRGVIRKY